LKDSITGGNFAKNGMLFIEELLNTYNLIDRNDGLGILSYIIYDILKEIFHEVKTCLVK
jgi:hypothetical protein